MRVSYRAILMEYLSIQCLTPESQCLSMIFRTLGQKEKSMMSFFSL
ncbi:hypothetical protein BSF44_04640 [Pseudomonas sp. ACN8]|nr:hypothetical protein BSF44_04640 [Pseudomonas sp. ACN8]